MTDKEKLEKIKRLADDMYYKMAYLTSDTRPIRKAMEDYHSFIVHEYNKDEQVDTPIDFKQELYKAFGQVRDFTLGMQIAKRFYEMGKQHQESVSIWHDASEKPNIKEKSGIFVITLLNGEYIGSRYYNYDDITINFGNYDKWAYLNDLVNLPNVERIGKDCI